MKKSILLSILLVFTAASIHAQLADSIKVYLLRDFQRSKSYTQEYLDAMPADKYGYRPNDSVRTFALQMLHLADATNYFASTATGTPNPRPDGLEKMKNPTKDSVVAAVNASYDFMISSLEKTSPSTWLEIAKSGNRGFPKLIWFQKALEHQAHHRGQTTIYIRMQGIKPPRERLF
jgi:uncharacterized damage-inducible protein DinB